MKNTRNLIIFSAISVTSIAWAQQGMVAETSTAAPVHHMTKDEALEAAGLKKYATPENEEISKTIYENIEAVKAQAGRNYAGSWVEYDENNVIRQFVALKGPVALSPKLAPVNNWTIVQARFSEAELLDIRDQIVALFATEKVGDEPLVLSVAPDIVENKLLVRGRHENGTRIQQDLLRNGFGPNVAIVDIQEGPVQFMGNIYGGTKIISSSDGNPRVMGCTAAFNVVIDGVYPGTITSAHCAEYDRSLWKVYFNNGTTASPIKGPYIGEWMASGWNQNMDAVIFGNTDFVHVLYPQYLIGAFEPRNVQPLIDPLVGSDVCTYGATSGWRCGKQSYKNISHRAFDRNFILSEGSFCGAPGDSGGPTVSRSGQAVGVFTGAVGGTAAGTCGATFGQPNRSVYQPLPQYLNANQNVKLLMP